MQFFKCLALSYSRLKVFLLRFPSTRATIIAFLACFCSL